MQSTKACLVDVYETALSCDFAGHNAQLPMLAGVDAVTWNRLFSELAPALSDGRISMADAHAAVVASSGQEPDAGLIGTLLRRDRELLVESAILHQDTMPFLRQLRERGIKTAFVSNCAENTRPLLDALGLSRLVDASVLSCEVGFSKPAPEIFLIALERLGVTASEAVFIDDQQAYCDGAEALGIRSIRIDRSPSRSGDAVATLEEAADLL